MTHNPATTSSSRPASSGRLPISRKAYDRFVARIKDVYSGYILDPTPMLEALDDYLAGNKGAHFRLPALAYLAFLVLRQDIDAAIERSRAARERARKRRAGKNHDASTDESESSAPPPADDTPRQPPSHPYVTPPHTPSPPDGPQPSAAPTAVTSTRPKKRIKIHNGHARRVSPRIFMQLDNVPT